MPSGLSPLVGVEAIREFWFPDDGSRTVIENYEMHTTEIGGSSTVAYSRGAAQLSFRYEKDDQVVRQTNHTMYLTVYRKGVEGEWRMIRRMWGPTQ